MLHPDRWWYVSELARTLKIPKTSLQRELVNLSQAEILRKRTVGKQVFYQANPECPFLPELQGLMAKTAGLVDVLRQALSPIASRIAIAFVYGSVARAQDLSTSDVDLMVIGDAGARQLALPLRKARLRLEREVNVSTYTATEFGSKARAGQYFISTVLGKPKLFVIGTQSDLEGIAESGTRRAHTRHPRRIRPASSGSGAKPGRRAP